MNTRLLLSVATLSLAAVLGTATVSEAKDKTVMVGGAAMYPSKNIVANAVNSKDHTTLVAAVKAAGLVDTLSGPGPFTVFAPTNAAFAKLPKGTVETLVKPESKATLTKILTYHVVPGKVNAAQLSDGQKLTTVELWACASPRYLASHGRPERPADLARHRLITRIDAISHWGFRDAAENRIEIVVNADLVVPEPTVMMTLAMGGCGIARLPDFLAKEAIAAGKLVRLLPEFQADRVDVHALYTSRRTLPLRARVFINALIEHLALGNAPASKAALA